jgi:hypothetical protein
MTARIAVTLSALALLAGAAAHAQEPGSPESLAQAKAGEEARLDLQTIRKFGQTQGRFEVVVAWADSSRPAPEDYGPRQVRYMANCDEGTISLAAIGVFDRSGQLTKTMIIPPGGADPIKPEKGSQEAKWLQRVCMF